MKRLIVSLALVVGTLVVLTPAPVAAEVLRITFSGLKLKFDNGNIFDSDHQPGGNGSTGEATPLTSIVFEKLDDEGAKVADLGSLTGSGLFADILAAGVKPIPKDDWDGVWTTSDSFVDLLTSSGGRFLHLNLPLGWVNVYHETNGLEYVHTEAYDIDNPTRQNLPISGIALDAGNVMVNLTVIGLTNRSPAYPAGPLTRFDSITASGYVEGTFASVPEPGSLTMLMSLAASALAAYAWRRRS
jgi:hypothetical protein